MLVSVFTPTHNPTWLKELYDCLVGQSHDQWEWVILCNGPRRHDIQAAIRAFSGGDHRVRPYITDIENSIGALKQGAVAKCTGKLLVEVDHDDLISKQCLEILVAAVGDHDDAFLFSDNITCDFEGASRVFTPDFGWKNYPCENPITGRASTVNCSYPVTARSLSDILYAPDHVRAWTRAAYDKAGGHNPDYRVADDYDLVVRTYLAGTVFTYIASPLYVHRLKAENTSQQSLGEIASRVSGLRDKYLHPLVGEWCRRENLPMFDLGGAHNCPPGYIPVDPALPNGHKCDYPSQPGEVRNALPRIKGKESQGLAVDVFRLRHELPSNSVGCFRAADFLEHIPASHVPDLMNTLYDLLVPGGFLLTSTPAVCDDEGRAGRGAWQDPTHVSGWSSNNFWYYTDRNFAKYVPEIQCKFQTVRLFNYYPSDWHRFHLIPYVVADLCAHKGGHHPGPVNI